MQAIPGKTYAHVVDGVVRALFTSAELPEWNNEMYPCVEVPNGVTVAGGHLYDGETFEAPPGPSLDSLRNAARDQIDTMAGVTRMRYITVVPGQEAVYVVKAQQAAAFASTGFSGTVPSFIAAEATATGLTPQATAERILQLEALWVGVIGPAIEATRVGGKDAVAVAVTAEAINGIVASVRATLDALP
jgi:hypothetical protein